MNKISSFTVNHLILPPGIYISREDGDIITYDIRFRQPNVEEPMENSSIHTIEHLVATFCRNSPLAENVIYFGPMGCRTGFYLLMRNTPHIEALTLIKDSLKFVSSFEGQVPGTSAIECGNYLEHDLQKAKQDSAKMYKIVKDLITADLSYPS